MTDLPPSSGASDPTQALPPSYPPTGGYAPPPGATPPPAGYGPPTGGYGPPTGGYGQPTAPPPAGGSGGMSTGSIVAIAVIVVVAVIAAGIGIVVVTGGGDDEAGSTTTEQESTTTEEESTTTEDPGTNPDEISVDGEETVEGTLTNDEPNFHQLAVPDGQVALVTVTPTTDDFDLVLTGGGKSFDDGLAGDPETVEVTGPGTFELSVVGYQGATGSYTVTIEEAP